MKKTIIVCGCIALMFAISCAKKTTATGSKKSAVNYEANIKPLMETKCAPCHIPAKGGNKAAFDTYAGASRYIDEMIRRVEMTPGTRGFMPFKHDPLPAEEIAMLKKWKEHGLKEN
jgi:hypothetical protein